MPVIPTGCGHVRPTVTDRARRRTSQALVAGA